MAPDYIPPPSPPPALNPCESFPFEWPTLEIS